MPFANSNGASAATAQSSPANRRNLWLRIASGVVLGPLVLLLAKAGGMWFAVGVAAASAIGFLEWLRIVRGNAPRAAVAGPVAILLFYWALGPFGALAVLAILAIGLGLEGQLFHRPVPWLAAAGLPYVGLTLVAFPWLRDQGTGWPFVLFVFLVVWGSDIGGYAFGRALGGPKLAPSISPNKTWAGLFGSLIVAATAALAWALALQIPAPLYAMVLAALLSLVGQGGDLFESSLKRRFHLKDSGELIPGHGGMLDRIDALLWVAPVFALIHLLGGTVGLTP